MDKPKSEQYENWFDARHITLGEPREKLFDGVCENSLRPIPICLIDKSHYDEALAEIEKIRENSYVPGILRCKKCDFSLVKQNLYVKSGTTGPNNNPENCANGCGPMWKVTWKEQSDRSFESCEKLFTENQKLREALSSYYEYFEAIKRGEYKENRRSQPLRQFEQILQDKARAALEGKS